MITAVFYSHLGLGDMLINNALVRELATDKFLCVLCKHHNVPSCEYQWRDNKNIKVIGVTDDAEASAYCKFAETLLIPVIRNGFHNHDTPFYRFHWDKEFYRQAAIDYSKSWTSFKVDRDLRQEVTTLPPCPYAFIHDDSTRGHVIDMTRIDSKLVWFRPDKLHSNIFAWCEAIEHATEIHCMESCFAILADRIPTTATRLVMHAYARRSIAPTYKKAWEILR